MHKDKPKPKYPGPFSFIEYANRHLQSRENMDIVRYAIESEHGSPLLAVSDLPNPRLATLASPFPEISITDYISSFYNTMASVGQDINEAIIKRGHIRTPLDCGSNEMPEEFFQNRGRGAITTQQLESPSLHIHIDRTKEVAFEAQFGFLDGQCLDQGTGLNECLAYAPWTMNLDLETRFQNEPHITCVKCHQRSFIEIMNKITSGVPLRQIPGLEELLHLGVYNYRRTILWTEDGNVRDKAAWRSPADPIGIIRPGPHPEYPFKHIFNHYLLSLIAYSLAAILNDPDFSRERIHKCEICGEFFVGVGRPDQKFCPKPECQKLRGNRRAARSMAKRREEQTKAAKKKIALKAKRKAELLKMELKRKRQAEMLT